MTKQLKKAKKNISLLVKIVEVLINYLLKTVDKIDAGIDKLKDEQDFHGTIVEKSLNRIDKIAEEIQEHEDEARKALKFAHKLEDFLD